MIAARKSRYFGVKYGQALANASLSSEVSLSVSRPVRKLRSGKRGERLTIDVLLYPFEALSGEEHVRGAIREFDSDHSVGKVVQNSILHRELSDQPHSAHRCENRAIPCRDPCRGC